MKTLLLRLAGAMQSWGTQSRFSIRDTGLEPSKSGVIGLLCASLGKPRVEIEGDGFPTIAELVAIQMGVRVDREGVMKSDYHTAGGSHLKNEIYGVARASGGVGGTVLSTRYYLSDANFLVGLESEDEALLKRLDDALINPHWQLSLGRKAFVAGLPIHLPDGLCDAPLLEALKQYEWKAWCNDDLKAPPARLRIVVDASAENATEVRQDVPLSFAERRFTIRYVKTDYIAKPIGGEPCISQD
jgi:CRISPR system Cascade subunit CasD